MCRLTIWRNTCFFFNAFRSFAGQRDRPRLAEAYRRLECIDIMSAMDGCALVPLRGKYLGSDMTRGHQMTTKNSESLLSRVAEAP